MNYLENFIQIGNWCLSEKHSSHKILSELNLHGINFEIENEYRELKDVIYLFKSNEEIFYIGETSSGLKNRFSSYRYGFDKLKDTDNRVKFEITSRLTKGEKITIHAWQPFTEFNLSGEILKIPLSKPIEEFLISKFSQKFNLINNKGNNMKYLNEDIINKIFVETPKWDLRGTPYVWSKLRDKLSSNASKINSKDFEQVTLDTLSEIFKNDGESISEDIVFLKDFPNEGMSGGQTSISWWHEVGIPTLVKKLDLYI